MNRVLCASVIGIFLLVPACSQSGESSGEASSAVRGRSALQDGGGSGRQDGGRHEDGAAEVENEVDEADGGEVENEAAEHDGGVEVENEGDGGGHSGRH